MSTSRAMDVSEREGSACARASTNSNSMTCISNSQLRRLPSSPVNHGKGKRSTTGAPKKVQCIGRTGKSKQTNGSAADPFIAQPYGQVGKHQRRGQAADKAEHKQRQKCADLHRCVAQNAARQRMGASGPPARATHIHPLTTKVHAFALQPLHLFSAATAPAPGNAPVCQHHPVPG